jgi:hypothetical protein
VTMTEMPATTSVGNLPQLTVQGIAVPRGVVDPPGFFKATRKQRFLAGQPISTWAGFGETDTIEARKAGILSAIEVHFVGSLVVTPGSGTVASTSKWPLDLPYRIRLSVNGGSFICNCSGAKLRARKFMSLPGLTDRGVSENIGGSYPGTAVTQGTLGYDNDSWGVGSGVSGISAGTYAVDLSWEIPVAWDQVKLFGALFLQTSATSIEITIQWEQLTNLFTTTGNATVTMTGGWYAEGINFDIPNQGGTIVLPDLSVYHTILESDTGSISTTGNEVDWAGQGVGKTAQRIFGQVWSGATGPGSPLAMNATNYGQLAWMYGGNQQPETWQDGKSMAIDMEQSYGSDFSKAGFWCFDFAKYWSFRDGVNEGDASELRSLITINSALTNPRMEYVREEMVAGALAG